MAVDVASTKSLLSHNGLNQLSEKKIGLVPC